MACHVKQQACWRLTDTMQRATCPATAMLLACVDTGDPHAMHSHLPWLSTCPLSAMLQAQEQLEGTSSTTMLEEMLVLAPIAVRAPAQAVTLIVLFTHLTRNLLWILDRWFHRFHEGTDSVFGECSYRSWHQGQNLCKPEAASPACICSGCYKGKLHSGSMRMQQSFAIAACSWFAAAAWALLYVPLLGCT